MSSVMQPPRTYNQSHVPRKYIRGKRRVSIYWTCWSYPWEANRDLSKMDNRFSTMTEVRRVAWPAYEATEWDEMHFMQGIAGTLRRLFPPLYYRVSESRGRSYRIPAGGRLLQRIDQAGYKLPD